MTDNSEEARYAIALTRLSGVTLTMALHTLRERGTAADAFDYLQQEALRARRDTTAFDEALARADAEMDFCRKKDIAVWTLTDEAYPTLLRDCTDAPLTLYYRGTAPLNGRHCIAVVGTRRITGYGVDLCRQLCADLHRLVPDCLVVSGLAYGVDIHTHRACLEVGAETVAVLAHGLDRIYPTLHRATAAQMTTAGGLLTEYASGTQPDKGNFIRRNRIIAGMTQATLVVESAEHGGALITARIADSYNRDVMAFPGRLGDPYSAGCNALIRDNKAQLVTSADDIVNYLGWTPAPTEKPRQGELFPSFSPLQQRIVDLLESTGGESIDRMAIALNTPVKDINGALIDLELFGTVRPQPGGRYELVTRL